MPRGKVPLVPEKSTKYIEFCERQSSASLGHHKIGTVRVDCCFLLSKTQWGKLEDKQAGLMYLDLTFHQPKECRLANATVTLTFREMHGVPNTKQGALEVTEYFGPQTLIGEKREQHVTKNIEIKPKLGAMYATIGGLGGDRSTEITYASRWKFEGKRFPADKSRQTAQGRYRQVEWHLEESELERQIVHSPTIHTGVVFEYEGLPFFLDLQIKGKLQRRHQRVLQRLVCPPRNRTARTTALIKAPEGTGASDFSLNDFAEGLNRTMIESNLRPISEISDPMPYPDNQLLKQAESKVAEATRPPSDTLLGLAQEFTAVKEQREGAQGERIGDSEGIKPNLKARDEDPPETSEKQILKFDTLKSSGTTILSVIQLIPWSLANLLEFFIAGLTYLRVSLLKAGYH